MILAGALYIGAFFADHFFSRLQAVGGVILDTGFTDSRFFFIANPPLAASLPGNSNRVEFGNVRKVIGSQRNG